MNKKDWGGNKRTTYAQLGASNHCLHERQSEDFYSTDPIAINKLKRVYEIPNNIVEISAGDGHLSERLKELGHNVISWDIIERNYPLDKIQDFLGVKELPKGYSILTNPPFKCVDIETECYTKRGWLKYTELNDSDEILSINPNTLLVEWSKINYIIEKDIDEDVYHFKKSHMDILCTKGHRMFAYKHGKISVKDGDLIHSEDTHSQHYIPRIGYSWEGNTIENFVLPSVSQTEQYTRKQIKKEEKEISMKYWLKFFGMWLADGYCTHTNNSLGKPRYIVGIKQLAKNKDLIRDMLNNLPFKYTEHLDVSRKNPAINFEIYDKQLWQYLHQFGKSHQKFIPTNIKELNSDYLQILVDAYFSGDGSQLKLKKQGNSFMSRTISIKLAEDIQEILFKLGYLSHVTESEYILQNKEKRTQYCQTISKNSMYNKYFYPSCKKSKAHYKGKVWCPNLEKMGCFWQEEMARIL